MPAARTSPPSRFLLSVDHAGEFLVLVGSSATLGHVRPGVADLTFLANLGALHARIVRVDSLREGPRFYLLLGENGGAGGCLVAGHRVREEGLRLFDGDLVRLGENVPFTFRLPDPASETAVLELGEGIECAGARAIVLLGEGEGGRLRIGSTSRRHVRVAGLEEELEIVVDEGAKRAHVRSQEGGLLDGVVPPDGAERAIPIALPPETSRVLSFPRARRTGPPFVVALAPAELGSPAAVPTSRSATGGPGAHGSESP